MSRTGVPQERGGIREESLRGILKGEERISRLRRFSPLSCGFLSEIAPRAQLNIHRTKRIKSGDKNLCSSPSGQYPQPISSGRGVRVCIFLRGGLWRSAPNECHFTPLFAASDRSPRPIIEYARFPRLLLSRTVCQQAKCGDFCHLFVILSGR